MATKKNTKTNKIEEFNFQAEMSQLLNLITHSLYSHREIFLRELISNASDALQKLHFASLTDNSVLKDDPDLKIKIQIDEEAKTLTISDNGIGMNKDDLQNNIGTIAHSGTAEFLKNLTGDQKKDEALIGKFGVGFYSVFTVADEVTVETKFYQDEVGYRWISKGTGTYSIEEIAKEDRGTSISFKLKDDCEEFATKWKVNSIIKKYSDFVSFPIEVNEEKANESKALWTKNKNEIKPEEYQELFKHITNSSTEAFAYLHLTGEAASVEFKAILFVPQEPDNNLFTVQAKTRLHLYNKRVFIQDDCEELLPQWMRFIRGVVDCDGLPLNVSREITQKTPILGKIQKYLVRKFLTEIKDWSENDAEKYTQFWENFGTLIKEGIHTDFENRDKLIELYRCHSSASPDKLISLKEYFDRMGEGQEEIYYVFGHNQATIENSPNIEYFKKNDIEVLYLYDEIDDFIMPSIGKYQEKALVSIDKADLKITNDTKITDEENKLSESETKKLIDYIKDLLGERVSDVIESQRLVDSPCTLVAPKDAMNAHMEKMMRNINKDFQATKKILEINSNNELIKSLAKIQEKRPQDQLIKDCVEHLFENASLVDGSLEDHSKMSLRSTQIMEKATNLYVQTLN